MIDLKTVKIQVSAHKPRRFLLGPLAARASVAVICRWDATAGLQVLLMKRAERAGDPWSGHMSFPGGKVQSNDQSGFAAAVRETQEEVGLDLRLHGQYIGRLSELVTRRHEKWAPMRICPYVFLMSGSVPQLNCNAEAEELLWLPLNYLVEEGNRQMLRYPAGRLVFELPCFYYQRYKIWGLTLSMLDEFTSMLYGLKQQSQLKRKIRLRGF